MPSIVTLRCKDESHRDVISVVLSQDAVSAGPDGDPWCAVTLTAAQARSLAQRLLNIALEIKNQEEPGYRTSSRSISHLSSIVAVHEGSQQGHRALQAAQQLASQSFCNLELFGVFGISGTGQASDSSEDYEWQKGWLIR